MFVIVHLPSLGQWIQCAQTSNLHAYMLAAYLCACMYTQAYSLAQAFQSRCRKSLVVFISLTKASEQ